MLHVQSVNVFYIHAFMAEGPCGSEDQLLCACVFAPSVLFRVLDSDLFDSGINMLFDKDPLRLISNSFGLTFFRVEKYKWNYCPILI